MKAHQLLATALLLLALGRAEAYEAGYLGRGDSLQAGRQWAPQAAPQCECAEPPNVFQSGAQQQASSGRDVAQLSCGASHVTVQQELAGSGPPGALSLAEVSAAYQLQHRSVTMVPIALTAFTCLDDRVSEPALATPGGDLGEFMLGLSSYLQERDGTGTPPPRQEVVDAFLLKYLKTLPAGRSVVHCTDDRAVRHLEDQLMVENLDLQRPPERARHAGLLERLSEVENQGDSHMRLLLKQPEWFQVDSRLPPVVLKSFYKLLWAQNQDPSSYLYQSPKLRLMVLVGESNPEAFIEVSAGDACRRDGMAPMLVPREAGHPVLISHLDAVGARREELATFFSQLSDGAPRKVDRQRLRQLLDRHGWLALETTGKRIASGLPFFTVKYE